MSRELRWWEELHAAESDAVYATLRRRLPQEGPTALLLIDIVTAFVGPEGTTLDEAVAEWPTACGPYAYDALPHAAELLDTARQAHALVVHCRPGAEYAHFQGDTVKGELEPDWVNGRPGAVDFAEQVQPVDGELVIPKPKASAFFDTGLVTVLRRAGVRNLVIGGATTSGCVRASVVDAFSHGFAPFVVEDAVFDRSRTSAAVALFDMDSRYADVIRTADGVSLLSASLPATAGVS